MAQLTHGAAPPRGGGARRGAAGGASSSQASTVVPASASAMFHGGNATGMSKPKIRPTSQPNRRSIA